MLTGFENGYELAKFEWSKIKSLHEKIGKFVRNRLTIKYGDEIVNGTIPAHLLGKCTFLQLEIKIYVFRRRI